MQRPTPTPARSRPHADVRGILADLQRAALSPESIAQFQAALASIGVTESIRGLAKERFALSDFAWVVKGTHCDGSHSVPFESAHPALVKSWNQTGGPYRGKEERALWREQLKGLMYDAVILFIDIVSTF
jgi:hypothetical protein